MKNLSNTSFYIIKPLFTLNFLPFNGDKIKHFYKKSYLSRGTIRTFCLNHLNKEKVDLVGLVTSWVSSNNHSSFL